MKLKSLAQTATRGVSRQVLVAQKHSPTGLFVSGAIGVTAGMVLACIATLKLGRLLDESEDELTKVELIVTEENEEETKAQKKASFNVKLQLAVKVAKLYAPAAVVTIISVGALTGSHVILRRRNVALTAAYGIVDKGFKEYRARVIADQGEEKDREYRYGVVEREIVEEGPHGQEVTVIRGLDQEAVKKTGGVSSYSRVFDDYNPNWSAVPMQNHFFLGAQRGHANDLLRLKGYVFLNEVYDLIGYEPTQAGQQIGWVRNPESGDGYIDFGIAANKLEGKLFVTGKVDSILLDFNVDGVVLDMLKRV